jgi:hypothetical protein
MGICRTFFHHWTGGPHYAHTESFYPLYRMATIRIHNIFLPADVFTHWGFYPLRVFTHWFFHPLRFLPTMQKSFITQIQNNSRALFYCFLYKDRKNFSFGDDERHLWVTHTSSGEMLRNNPLIGSDLIVKQSLLSRMLHLSSRTVCCIFDLLNVWRFSLQHKFKDSFSFRHSTLKTKHNYLVFVF